LQPSRAEAVQCSLSALRLVGTNASGCSVERIVRPDFTRSTQTKINRGGGPRIVNLPQK